MILANYRIIAHPEELQAESIATAVGDSGSTSGNQDEQGQITAESATAQSLQCQDCGKMFKDGISIIEFYADRERTLQNFMPLRVVI